MSNWKDTVMTDDDITAWLYNCLKEIEVEENVRLSDKAFIADCLTLKLKTQLADEIIDLSRE